MRALLLVVLLVSCHRRPPSLSAGDVCYKLVDAGVAGRCQVGSRGELGLIERSASEYVTFDVVGSPGVTGRVLQFKNAHDYGETIADLETAASIVGPHRYGSPSKLILVRLDKHASVEAGAKAASVVASLALAPPKLDR